jgi:hypothetical protein
MLIAACVQVAVKQVVKGTVSADHARRSASNSRKATDLMLGTATTRRRSAKSGNTALNAIRDAFITAKLHAAQVSATHSGSVGALSTKSKPKGFLGMLQTWMGSSYQRRVLARRRRQNFIKEMRLLNGLRHPCIAQIMGAVIVPSMEPMMVMVRGGR